MKITIEITEEAELQSLIQWLTDHNQLDKVEFSEKKSPIVRGDKSLDPTALFGLWKDNPRTLKAIREASWGNGL